MEERVERRVLLDAPAGFSTPRPLGEPVDERAFTTTVFDAPDRILASAGLGLNRRLENGRSVWQLTLPAQRGTTRTLTVAGGPSQPPDVLRELLAGVLRERQLGRIATHRTKRSSLRVRQNGHHVAKVAQDEIAVMEGQRVERKLNQLEVSLAIADDRVGRRLLKRLRRAGATRRAEPAPPPVGEGSSALEQTRAMLAAQLREILQHDPGTRLGADPEDLHRMRVATRRARAVLRAARPLLEAEWSDSLRAELGWLGSSLGEVRDLDVLLAHLREEAARLGDEEEFAAQRIVHGLEAERKEARGALLEALESERYAALLDRLEQAALAPVGKEAAIALPALAAAEFESLRKVASKLDASSTDEELHRARVKAKRARYAAELAEPFAGGAATRFIDRAKGFQEVVGEHQDAVVAEQRIRALAGSGRATKVAFAAGRLVERERGRRAAARKALPVAWSKLDRSGRRAWS